MEKGYLSLVLHAHLPFVHHPESRGYLEEHWLYEAMTETYLPLLDVFEGLFRDGVGFRITMSLSPPLLAMLASPLLQHTYLDYLDRLIALSEREAARTGQNERHRPLAEMYLNRFLHFRRKFTSDYGGNLIEGFKRLARSGHLELITCSATHAFLPYIRTEQALRAQLENAVRMHVRHLGVRPRGIWLPECGYREGLDRLLKEYGFDYFFTDTHGVLHSTPAPKHGVYAPVAAPSGVAAFARDPETSRQVWSSIEGYPGDYDYREYYRDIGFEREYEEIRPYLHPSGVRHNTGLKYWRITGNGWKDWYDPQRAAAKAALHAGHFVSERMRQAEDLAGRMDRKPLIVACYDAELFGHWWYEGPQWIDALCRKLQAEPASIRLIAPGDYLREYPETPSAKLSMSSWGRGGYGEVWLGESNAWIYRHLHRMEERMMELADRFPSAEGLERRALNQAVRELLLAQSSDWAFIMDSGTMVDYAVKRFKRHTVRFNRLYRGLMSGTLQEPALAEMEEQDAHCPDADYRVFRSDWAPVERSERESRIPEGPRKRRVLMLSWEFPPVKVGGLSTHVDALSRELAALDIEVHVVTCHVDGCPAYEVLQGVHVHRVHTSQSRSLQFMEWVLQLNLGMLDYARQLIRRCGPFDLLHAHDWLVGEAAVALKRDCGLPLLATIHATEHGRNQGIHTDLQRSIHRLEERLAWEAERVICCSRYMEREIRDLFRLPSDRLKIIPNGVSIPVPEPESVETDIPGHASFAAQDEKIIFFVGRLVREKGVHVLLESIPSVLDRCPEAVLVIAGRGPALEELKGIAAALNIAHKVRFAGYIDDETRNRLYRSASVSVFPSLYEPFGIVALEAMAAGTPVIVSGTGGLQEIVDHGADGYTVLPGDRDSLARHMIRMLQDQPAASAMAERARRKAVREYGWSRIARYTAETYSDLLNDRRGVNSDRDFAEVHV